MDSNTTKKVEKAVVLLLFLVVGICCGEKDSEYFCITQYDLFGTTPTIETTTVPNKDQADTYCERQNGLEERGVGGGDYQNVRCSCEKVE